MHWSESCRVFPTICRIFQTLVPSKRSRQLFASLLVLLLLGANSQAQEQAQARVQAGGQASDWQLVKNLMPGTRIAVKTQHRYRCWVESVTDDELVCGTHAMLRSVTLVIRRSEIHEIRILPQPNQAKDAWIGAGIGAGAGAIAAGTIEAESPGRNYPAFHAFVGGVAGAGGGALVGGIVPIFQVLFQRGKIVYKR